MRTAQLASIAAPATGPRGARSTLAQKIAFSAQSVISVIIAASALASPQPILRHYAAATLIAILMLLALMFWTHFLARPLLAGERPRQRAPHFSPHVFLGLITLFLGTLDATLYYRGALTNATILAQSWEWLPITLPLQPILTILWSAASILYGIRQPRRMV